MNTTDILDKCRDLPEVTVTTEGCCTTLLLSGSAGRMTFFPLFPGVTLATIVVAAPSWPAPQPERCTPDARGPLIVNYCTRGRCELILNDNRHVFLTAGQISLTERFAQKEYLYPGRLYEGIELFIDPETVSDGQPLLYDGFGLDLRQLRTLYCPAGETFIAKLPLPEARLAAAPAAQVPAGLKTGVIDLLSLLLSAETRPQPVQPVYYTKSQVEIAKRTEALITADLAHTHTVREFAARFGVSESSIKNYFLAVFGQSISQYTTHRRMLRAAELLAGTQRSVMEIANEVGYLNQSKFSSAFRRTCGCSPLEYRRAAHIAAGPDR